MRKVLFHKCHVTLFVTGIIWTLKLCCTYLSLVEYNYKLLPTHNFCAVHKAREKDSFFVHIHPKYEAYTLLSSALSRCRSMYGKRLIQHILCVNWINFLVST